MPEKIGRIAVIGGANMDIGGFPTGALTQGESNPGQVRLSPGGVGRNIAENCALLGLEVELVTALGSDNHGRMLLEDCQAKGIGTSGCIVVPDGHTSVYLFIGDARGDMHCAISDMEVQSELTPERIAPRLALLNAMDAVVVDTNLSEETLVYLVQQVRVPLFADTVSAAKAIRLRRCLPHLFCIKPNRMEASMLAGLPIRDAMDASQAAQRLNQSGVQRVYLTMGTQGALYAENGRCSFLRCIPSTAVNATGAGDAFTAALVWAHCEGLGPKESGIAGMAAAMIAVNAMDTVNPQMNRAALIRKMTDLTNMI